MRVVAHPAFRPVASEGQRALIQTRGAGISRSRAQLVGPAISFPAALDQEKGHGRNPGRALGETSRPSLSCSLRRSPCVPSFRWAGNHTASSRWTPGSGGSVESRGGESPIAARQVRRDRRLHRRFFAWSHRSSARTDEGLGRYTGRRPQEDSAVLRRRGSPGLGSAMTGRASDTSPREPAWLQELRPGLCRAGTIVDEGGDRLRVRLRRMSVAAMKREEKRQLPREEAADPRHLHRPPDIGTAGTPSPASRSNTSRAPPSPTRPTRRTRTRCGPGSRTSCVRRTTDWRAGLPGAPRRHRASRDPHPPARRGQRADLGAHRILHVPGRGARHRGHVPALPRTRRLPRDAGHPTPQPTARHPRAGRRA